MSIKQILIGGAMALLVACNSTPAPSPSVVPATPSPLPPTQPVDPTATPEPNIVDVNLGLAPVTIDPTFSLLQDAAAKDVIENVFIGLTRLDPDSGDINPWLAREWEQDGTRWTFFLRDDVFWVRMNPTNGQIERVRPVVAGDVVAAIARACAGPSDLPGLQAVLFVEGCATLNQLDAPPSAETIQQELGARVLNDVALEITMREEAAFLPELLAMPVFRPIPADEVSEGWTQPDQIMTSGPFALQPNIPAQEGYTLVANPHWPLEREGNLDVIQIGFSEEGFAAWQRGEVQVSVAPPGEASIVHSQPVSVLLGFNYDTFPFDKIGVRQAFMLALDQQAVVDAVLSQSGQTLLASGSVVPPGTPNFTPVSAPPPDIATANTKLADANHANCINIPNTTLLTDQSAFSLQLGEAIIAQWQAAFGCPANLLRVEQVPPGELLIARREPVVRQFQPDRAAIVLLYWQGDYLSPHHYFADVLGCAETFPDAYLNAGRLCTPADEAVSQLATTYEANQRRDLAAEINTGFFGPNGEAPAVPLYHFGRALAVTPGLTVLPETSGPLQFDRWVWSSP